MRHVEWLDAPRTLGQPKTEKRRSSVGPVLLWTAVIGGVTWIFFKTLSPVSP